MESKLLATIGMPSQLEGAFKGEFFQGQRDERVAFIGRSNVGKSSLINALLQKRLAYTSSTPGKTQVLNFFHSPRDKIVWVDLPGYGHANVARDKRKDWEKLIAKYLETDPKLRYLVILMDARHGPTDGDLEAIQYLSKLKGDLVFVFTKWDAVRTQSDRARTQKESILRLQSIGIDVKSHHEVFWISAKEKHGIPQLKKAVLLCPNKSS